MQDDNDEYTVTAANVLVNARGEMLTNVVATDHESFHSRLSPLADISQSVTNESVASIYSGNFWFTGMTVSSQGDLFVCDAAGRVHTNKSGVWEIEDVCPEAALRAIYCAPDDTLFTAGIDGKVYRREPDGWVSISDAFGQWINDIGGFSSSELTIVGDAGLVARYREGSWMQIEIASNATVNGVLAESTGQYLICGAKGLLMRGSDDDFEDLTSANYDLFKMAHYGGKVWVGCGSKGAGRLGETLEIEIMRDTFAAFRIHSNGSYVAFCGNDLIVRHNGKIWHGYRFN